MMPQDTADTSLLTAAAPAQPPRVSSRTSWLSRALDVLFLLITVPTVIIVLHGGRDTGATDEFSTSVALLFLCATCWIAVGLLWTAVRIWRIRRARQGDPDWSSRLTGRRRTRFLIIATAVIVVDSALNAAFADRDHLNGVGQQMAGIGMVLVAWTVLHLAYAERYARLELENTSGEKHLDFGNVEHPTLTEYAYFAFGVGTTFGTTDVNVCSTRMRGVVMCHGLLAFVYNTLALGLVISLISG